MKLLLIVLNTLLLIANANYESDGFDETNLERRTVQKSSVGMYKAELEMH